MKKLMLIICLSFIFSTSKADAGGFWHELRCLGVVLICETNCIDYYFKNYPAYVTCVNTCNTEHNCSDWNI